MKHCVGTVSFIYVDYYGLFRYLTIAIASAVVHESLSILSRQREDRSNVSLEQQRKSINQEETCQYMYNDSTCVSVLFDRHRLFCFNSITNVLKLASNNAFSWVYFNLQVIW